MNTFNKLWLAIIVIIPMSFSLLHGKERLSDSNTFSSPYRIEVTDQRSGHTSITVKTIDAACNEKILRWIAKNTRFPHDPPWLGKEARLPCLVITVWRNGSDNRPFEICYYKELPNDIGAWSISHAEVDILMQTVLHK